MILLIIGGTGKTGRELIKQALERGHQVTAFVRNPIKLKQDHPCLTVCAGDILNTSILDDIVPGHDAVLSALGHKRFLIKTTILSRGTSNLIHAMEKHRVKRLIAITALGINDSRFRLGLYYTFFTIPFILFFYFLDKAKQERLIRDSILDWTIIRPGQLTNGKKRMIYKHGPYLGSYILTKTISRADVAHFMLNQLTDHVYLRKCPGITK